MICITYHITSTGIDEWEHDYKIAMALYNSYKKDYGNAKLFQEVVDIDNNESLNRNCLASFGPAY